MFELASPKYEFRNGTLTRLAGMRLLLNGMSYNLSTRYLDTDGSPMPLKDLQVVVSDQWGNVLTAGLAQYNGAEDAMMFQLTPELTSQIGVRLVRWYSQKVSDYALDMLVVVDDRVLWLLNRLRALLDKSEKDVTKSWAFTDVDLFMYLVNAIGYFNTVPPVTYYSIQTLPVFLDDVILELAQLYGIQAQMMYAVDTDIIYNDQGISLTLDHFSKLQSLYGVVAQRILDNIRKVKWQMGARPKVLLQFNPERAMNYVFTQMVTPGFPYFAWGIGLYQQVFPGP